MLKTCTEISRQKLCSRQAASKFIIRNNIQPAGKKGGLPTYDTEKEPLASYLAAPGPAKGKTPPPPEKPRPTALPPPPSAEEAVRCVIKPLNNFITNHPENPGQKPAEFLFSQAVRLAQKNEDPTLFFKLGQAAAKEEADEALYLQAMETEKAKEQIAKNRAARLQLEYEIRRGEYLEKAVVKVLFGRVYAVHTSILTPMSLKLASSLAAIPPGDGKEATVKKLIDDEIYAALEMIKRQLADFIQFEDTPLDNKTD